MSSPFFITPRPTPNYRIEPVHVLPFPGVGSAAAVGHACGFDDYIQRPKTQSPRPQKTYNKKTITVMNSKAPSLNATEHPVGLDGYFTLILSCLVLITTAGLYWLWLIKTVYQCAKQAPTTVQDCDLIAVLGRRPVMDEISHEYKCRLNRAITLFEQGYANKILVVGGRTGDNTRSEEDLGIQYLMQKGLNADSLMAEDHSRHTLENLHNARRFFLDQPAKTTALITSRYHLARSHRMARSLGIVHRLCAAEDEFTLNSATVINVMKEAFFIHWYEIGRAWAYAANSQKSLSRIR